MIKIYTNFYIPKPKKNTMIEPIKKKVKEITNGQNFKDYINERVKNIS